MTSWRGALGVRSALVMCAVLTMSGGCGEPDTTGENPEDTAADAFSVPQDSGETTGSDAAAMAQDVGANTGVDAGATVAKCEIKAGAIGTFKLTAPVLWSQPLKDYHKVGFAKAPNGKFLQGVQDLAVFMDRLYIGYGDANINLGSQQQLTVKYLTTCSDPNPTDEFKHSEEQVDRFRLLGDELWIAGVDATEDGWLGNVYRRTKTQSWVKHRTVGSGVHVHDVARFGGDVYAVGSGNTPDGWKEGNIYGFLWRSSDNGKTFAPVDKEWNGGKGDSRMVHLVTAGPRLYLFGYKIDNTGKLASVPNKVWDGKTAAYLSQDHTLQLTFVRAAWQITENAGVVTGQNLLEGNNPPMRTWLLTAKDAAVLDALKDRVVVDVFHRADTGEFLLLSRPGTSPTPPANGATTEWTVTLTTDFATFKDVLKFPSSVPLESVAWWQGGLYIGTASGQLYRTQAN